MTNMPDCPDNDYRVPKKGKKGWKPVWRHSVDHRVVFSLTLIIVLCLILVTFLTAMIIAIDGHVIGKDPLDRTAARNPDEVVTMLAQIASTAVGALAGYFTAKAVSKKDIEKADLYDDDPPKIEDDD